MYHTDDNQAQANLEHTLQALRDQEINIQGIYLDGLSDMARPDLRRFQDTWMDLSEGRRRALVAALVELTEDRVEVSFADVFRWLMNDRDPLVRVHAVEGLWEDEDVRLIGPLVRMLESDPEPLVRAAAAISLGRYLLLGELDKIDHAPARHVYQALLSSFTGEEHDSVVRRRTLESLAYSGDSDIQELILMAYEDDDSDMRISAVFAMGRNADSRWKHHVLAELRSKDPAMRFEAIRASGELEISEAVPDILKSLNEEDVELRDAAVWALGRIGGPQARRALRACCASDDEDLREAAEEALAELDFFAGYNEMPAFFFAV